MPCSGATVATWATDFRVHSVVASTPAHLVRAALLAEGGCVSLMLRVSEVWSAECPARAGCGRYNRPTVHSQNPKSNAFGRWPV
eukprot:scaffold13535_cov114-Isochrysis_galbana.AAC.2